MAYGATATATVPTNAPAAAAADDTAETPDAIAVPVEAIPEPTVVSPSVVPTKLPTELLADEMLFVSAFTALLLALLNDEPIDDAPAADNAAPVAEPIVAPVMPATALYVKLPGFGALLPMTIVFLMFITVL